MKCHILSENSLENFAMVKNNIRWWLLLRTTKEQSLLYPKEELWVFPLTLLLGQILSVWAPVRWLKKKKATLFFYAKNEWENCVGDKNKVELTLLPIYLWICSPFRQWWSVKWGCNHLASSPLSTGNQRCVPLNMLENSPDKYVLTILCVRQPLPW